MNLKKLGLTTWVGEVSKNPSKGVVVTDMKAIVPIIKSIFINKELARKLVDMILLPQDQKE